MWMPYLSATMLQALFGYYLPDGVREPARPDATADFARRAGYRLGADGEWIADDGASARGSAARSKA
jgi:hypothetical protein